MEKAAQSEQVQPLSSPSNRETSAPSDFKALKCILLSDGVIFLFIGDPTALKREAARLGPEDVRFELTEMGINVQMGPFLIPVERGAISHLARTKRIGLFASPGNVYTMFPFLDITVPDPLLLEIRSIFEGSEQE